MKCDNGIFGCKCDQDATHHGMDKGTGMVLNFCKGHSPSTDVEWKVLFRGLVEAAAQRDSVQVRGEEVINPRAALERVALALESTPPGPYVPKTTQELRNILRVEHEVAVGNALFSVRVLLKTVADNAMCRQPGLNFVEGCFPSCMDEPHRSAYLRAKATLDREEELRGKLRELSD